MSYQFCSKCGNAIPAGSAFCPVCGARSAGDGGAIAYAAPDVPGEPLDANRSRWADQIVKQAFQHLDQAEAFRRRHQRAGIGGGFKAGIIVSVVFTGVMGLAFVTSLPGLVRYSASPAGSIVTLILALIAAASLVLCICLGSKASRRKKEEYKVQAEVNYQQGMDILKANYDAISFLPPEYWYPMATAYIANVVCTGRVSSLKEALGLFHNEYLQRVKLHRLQAQALATQQEQLRLLRDIPSSVWAADAVSASAQSL